MKILSRCLLFFFLSSYFSVVFAEDFYTRETSKAEDIYRHMSLDEKLGQLILPNYGILAKSVSDNATLCIADLKNPNTPKETIFKDCGLDQIKQYHIGAVLTGGGPYFNAPTLSNWLTLNQWASEEHRLGSPYDPLLLTGNDTIHGNMHVQGTVIFPHNIGLGVTHDPNLIYQIGLVVGQDSLASGFNWDYMPTVAVAQDLRWGRTYESFSSEPAYVKILARAYVKGFQNIQNEKITGALATAKHFLGDGATQYGLDEGDDTYTGNQKDFWQTNGQGYEGALQAHVGSIMVSYNAINGNNQRMHFGGNWDIINQFKNKGIDGVDGKHYRFTGFMVSDWGGFTRAAYFYDQANHDSLSLPEILAKSINGGVDMLMLGQNDTTNPFDPNSPLNYASLGDVFAALKTAYQTHLLSEARLHDAVIRILTVKLSMQPQTSISYGALQNKERKLALLAAEESLVLLKNKKVLPVDRKQIQNIVFIGETNDLGLQNGGWTINWQGQKGDQYFTGADKISSGATTLEEGVKKIFQHQAVNFYYEDNFPKNLNNKNTIAIAVLAEVPYAEFMGDIGNRYEADDWYNFGATHQFNAYLSLPQSQELSLAFDAKELAAIRALRRQGINVITVVYSGRPVILTGSKKTAPFSLSDVVVAAFLPGTLGGDALAHAIFGDYRFGSNGVSNRLSFPWPSNSEDVESHFKNGALFLTSYGLQD